MTNRWLLIWSEPRAVARDLLNIDPYAHVGVLVYLVLGLIAARRMLPLGVVTGPLLGLALYYLYGLAMRWVGSWFGGKADNDEVRTVVGWGTLTYLQTTFIFAVINLTYNLWWGKYVPAVTSYLIFALFILFTLWSLTIQWRVVAEAHSFSTIKGFATHLLGFLMVTIPLFALSYFVAVASV